MNAAVSAPLTIFSLFFSSFWTL